MYWPVRRLESNQSGHAAFHSTQRTPANLKFLIFPLTKVLLLNIILHSVILDPSTVATPSELDPMLVVAP